MHERQLFEYAVLRVVPRVEREEFINIGVVLFCASRKFLAVATRIDSTRLITLFPKVELEEVQTYVDSFSNICKGAGASPISKLIMAERFRWLTATRSTVLQTSKVHPGLCLDPEETLQTLLNQLVEKL